MVNNISLKKIYHKIRKIIIYIVAGVNGIRKNSVLGRILRFMGYNYINWDVISRMNNDFENDDRFQKGYSKSLKITQLDSIDWDPKWMFHVNQWAAEHAVKLEGDFIECGVYKGRHSISNIIYTDFGNITNKKYYLIDTFEGLKKSVSSDEEINQYQYSYKDQNLYKYVMESFKEFSNVIVVQGIIPDILSKLDIRKVAYLHLDMNCVFPEIEAFKYFWQKLTKSAIVILDDYAQPGIHVNQKHAFDIQAKLFGVSILSLPTGQGLIIKP